MADIPSDKMYEQTARRIRVRLLKMIMNSGSGHAGGGLSIIDILAVLYSKEMKIDPKNPSWEDRDRLVLSKGHAAFALYSALSGIGMIPEDELYTAYRMQAHPELGTTPGCEMSTGALGQGLSACQGMALAAKLAGKPTRCYAILGDGEMHEGQVWEAMMSIPKFHLDNLVAFLDYNNLSLSGSIRNVMPLEPLYSKIVAFGWHVIQINGHSYTQIVNALEEARNTKDRPTFIIAVCVKGRGIADFEDKWNCHVVAPNLDKGREYLAELGCGEDEIDSHVRLVLSKKDSLPKEEDYAPVIAKLQGKRTQAGLIAPRDVLGKALVDAGTEDPRIVVLDADFHPASKITPFRDAFPERFFEMGIAEQNMVSTAAGLASSGCIPFASCICTFASRRACDQLTVSVALPKLNVKIVGVYPGLFVGTNGASHQSLEDISIIRALPSFSIIHPADAIETRQAVLYAAKHVGPVYFRIGRDPVPQIHPDDYQFQFGKAYELRNGNDVTIICYGELVSDVLSAASKLESEGITARVLNMATIKPIDKEAVMKAVKETRRIVTVDNHNVVGGIGSSVAEFLCDEMPCKLKRLGVVDTFGKSGKNADMKQYFGLSSSQLAQSVLQFVREE